MLVTDRHATAGRDLVDLCAAALDGGVDAIQVREKDLPDADLLLLSGRLQRIAAGRALVLVNGRPGIARALGAGLHLPGDAPDPPSGPWPLWGRSVHSLDEAIARAAQKPDYLLLGTIFPTTSKPGHPGAGLALVRDVARAVAPIPVIAIGGIDARNAPQVIRAGAAGVAVRSAILEAPSPTQAAARIRASLP